MAEETSRKGSSANSGCIIAGAQGAKMKAWVKGPNWEAGGLFDRAHDGPVVEREGGL
jgi:hypothetical protein